MVPEEKLRGYLLNPDHSDGSHKLKVFQSAFDVGPDDWEYVREQFLTGVQTAQATSTRASIGCTLYTVPMPVTGLNVATKRVITSWKVPDGGGAPSFVTAYLDKRGA